MGAPWTRDATVRAYVVTMAPEVAGRIVELQVVDNGYVRKGDLLMVIDPTNYKIAVSQAEAAVQQAQASVQNIDAQIDCSAGTDQCQPGTTGSGAGGAGIRAATGRRATRPGARRLGHRSECPAVHIAAASAGSGGADCASKPQSGAAASRVAEGAAHERRGECLRKPRRS